MKCKQKFRLFYEIVETLQWLIIKYVQYYICTTYETE